MEQQSPDNVVTGTPAHADGRPMGAHLHAATYLNTTLSIHYHVRCCSIYLVPLLLSINCHPPATYISPIAAQLPNTYGQPSNAIATGLVTTPLDPSLTHQEASFLHAEIKALAQQLGLSYKDAAHCLYMAKVEWLKVADLAAHSFAAVKEQINKVVSHELVPVISAIDSWDFDDYIINDGHWGKKSTEDK
ncbi:hypothetical protein BYT27DRAFT_7256731 [Phlegmacium glaucopus]|nr:hypothetical protein BYT27DRAFT_7256731 [Phlegmacium glaucopus]